jgi:hypothetical protein
LPCFLPFVWLCAISDAMKTMVPLLVLAAALALSSCGRPQSVTDLKVAIVNLKVASEQDRTQRSGYDALLLDAQSKFELAKTALSSNAASATTDALAKAVDAEQVWRDTEVIDGGLDPATAAPLKRLGVAKSDADFRKESDTFITFEDDPDDDTPNDTAEKKSYRDDARHDLIKRSLAVVDVALGKAEDAL